MKIEKKQKLKISTFLTILLILAQGICLAQSTQVGGEITENQVWSSSENPYLVVTPIIVNPRVNLTIEAGVVIQMESGTYFDVQGYLSVNGTPALPVYFESNSNLNSWRGIRSNDTATVYVQNAVISGTATPFTAMRSLALEIDDSRIVIANEDIPNVWAVDASQVGNVVLSRSEFIITSTVTNIIPVIIDHSSFTIDSCLFNLEVNGTGLDGGSVIKLSNCNSGGKLTNSIIRANTQSSDIIGLNLYRCSGLELHHNAIVISTKSESPCIAIKASGSTELIDLEIDHFSIDLKPLTSNFQLIGLKPSGVLAVNLTNTIICNSEGKIDNCFVVAMEDQNSSVDMNYCNVYNVVVPGLDSLNQRNDNFRYDENTIIHTRPLWVDPSELDYTLEPESGCIDAGDPDFELDPDGILIEGEYQGTRTDIGMYYFHQILEDPGDTTNTIRPEPENLNLPGTFQISKVYPNPFNSSTRVEIFLPNSSSLNVSVYDIMGRLVSQLASDYYSAGRVNLYWQGNSKFGEITSGTYFIRAKSGNELRTQKVVLLK